MNLQVKQSDIQGIGYKTINNNGFLTIEIENYTAEESPNGKACVKFYTSLPC